VRLVPAPGRGTGRRPTAWLTGAISALATAGGTLVLAGAVFASVRSANVDLLYGDHEGGQRTIRRFVFNSREDGQSIVVVARHGNLDRPDPRLIVIRPLHGRDRRMTPNRATNLTRP
jgi:CHASE1-domain containing sensor protein